MAGLSARRIAASQQRPLSEEWLRARGSVTSGLAWWRLGDAKAALAEFEKADALRSRLPLAIRQETVLEEFDCALNLVIALHTLERLDDAHARLVAFETFLAGTGTDALSTANMRYQARVAAAIEMDRGEFDSAARRLADTRPPADADPLESIAFAAAEAVLASKRMDVGAE